MHELVIVTGVTDTGPGCTREGKGRENKKEKKKGETKLKVTKTRGERGSGVFVWINLLGKRSAELPEILRLHYQNPSFRLIFYHSFRICRTEITTRWSLRQVWATSNLSSIGIMLRR